MLKYIDSKKCNLIELKNRQGRRELVLLSKKSPKYSACMQEMKRKDEVLRKQRMGKCRISLSVEFA